MEAIQVDLRPMQLGQGTLLLAKRDVDCRQGAVRSLREILVDSQVNRVAT